MGINWDLLEGMRQGHDVDSTSYTIYKVIAGYCPDFGSDRVHFLPIVDIVLSFEFMNKDNYENTLMLKHQLLLSGVYTETRSSRLLMLP